MRARIEITQLAIERAWGQPPGWLGGQEPDKIALLWAVHRAETQGAR